MIPLRPRPARRARRLRARLPRRAVPWWAATLALAALTGVVVHTTLAGAVDARSRWGRTRPVLTATRAIAAGGAIDSSAAEVRSLPEALVPPGALRALPRGRVAVAAVARGEAVLASRVSGHRAAGVAALLPPGARALVIPLEVTGLPVRVGDRIDLLASGGGGPTGDLPPSDGEDPPSAADAGPVAAGALVVAVHRDALVVAVDADDAVAVAAALGQGPLVPALAGP